MVDFFGLGALRKRLDEAEQDVRSTVEHMRLDQANLAHWVAYLHQENKNLRQRIEWKPAGLTEAQVVTIVEKHAAFDLILSRIRGIEERIGSMGISAQRIHALEQQVEHKVEHHLASSREEVLSQLRVIADRVGKLEERSLQPAPQPIQTVQAEPAFSKLQTRLLKRIAKHPKHVVKSAILTLIQKYGRIQGTELREMVVEEQQLCSKSSFYRLLEELEKEGAIEVLGDGKEKTYADALFLKNKQ